MDNPLQLVITRLLEMNTTSVLVLSHVSFMLYHFLSKLVLPCNKFVISRKSEETMVEKFGSKYLPCKSGGD